MELGIEVLHVGMVRMAPKVVLGRVTGVNNLGGSLVGSRLKLDTENMIEW